MTHALGPPKDSQFDVALDISKQLLTLATVVVSLTVSFWKDVAGAAGVGRFGYICMGAAWVLFLLSILFGLWCCYAILGSIAKPIGAAGSPRSVYDTNVAVPMGAQQITFLFAVLATVAFGLACL
jgi:hypothetical protein